MTVYVSKTRGLSPVDGFIGGALAGLAQTFVVILYSVLGDLGFWTVPNLWNQLLGINVADATAFSGMTLLGIVINLVIMAVLGALYTLVARHQEGKAIIWSALLFGVIAWVIGYWLLLPDTVVGWAPTLHENLSWLTSGSSMLIYGSVLGAYLVRRQSRELVDSY